MDICEFWLFVDVSCWNCGEILGWLAQHAISKSCPHLALGGSRIWCMHLTQAAVVGILGNSGGLCGVIQTQQTRLELIRNLHENQQIFRISIIEFNIVSSIGDMFETHFAQLHIAKTWHCLVDQRLRKEPTPWRTSPPNGPVCHSENDPRAPVPFLLASTRWKKQQTLVAHLPPKINTTTFQSLSGPTRLLKFDQINYLTPVWYVLCIYIYT